MSDTCHVLFRFMFISCAKQVIMDKNITYFAKAIKYKIEIHKWESILHTPIQ